MTREDMKNIIRHYLWGASPKSVLEETDMDLTPREVEDFLDRADAIINRGIEAGTSMVSDIAKTSAYMIMDASQGENRLYWTGNGWSYNPCEAHRCTRREPIDDEYVKLVDDGHQASVVVVMYSRESSHVTVHQILLLHRTRNA